MLGRQITIIGSYLLELHWHLRVLVHSAGVFELLGCYSHVLHVTAEQQVDEVLVFLIYLFVLLAVLHVGLENWNNRAVEGDIGKMFSLDISVKAKV